MPSTLCYILYLSRRLADTRGSDVAAMLRKAQAFNQSHELTGLLVCGQHWFLQHLEGKRSDLNLVMRRIRAAPLHRDVIVMAEGILLGREFPSWTMGGIGTHNLDTMVAQCGLQPNDLIPVDFNTIPLIEALRQARDDVISQSFDQSAAPVVFLD